MRTVIAKLAEVEELAQTDSFFRSYLDVMEWPLAQYDREVLLSFMECKEEDLPKDTFDANRDGFRGHGCSRSVEVAFQRLENESRQHKAGRLSQLTRWQRLVAHDQAKENDRPPIEINSSDKYASLNYFPKTAMSTVGVECSLPDVIMDKIFNTNVLCE